MIFNLRLWMVALQLIENKNPGCGRERSTEAGRHLTQRPSHWGDKHHHHYHRHHRHHRYRHHHLPHNDCHDPHQVDGLPLSGYCNQVNKHSKLFMQTKKKIPIKALTDWTVETTRFSYFRSLFFSSEEFLLVWLSLRWLLWSDPGPWGWKLLLTSVWLFARRWQCQGRSLPSLSRLARTTSPSTTRNWHPAPAPRRSLEVKQDHLRWI